jgi:UPF0716 family protein affecting phage T7 exclusion
LLSAFFGFFFFSPPLRQFQTKTKTKTMKVVNGAKAGKRGRPIENKPEYERIQPGQAIVVPDSESVTKIYQRMRYWGKKNGRTFSINGNQIVRVA